MKRSRAKTGVNVRRPSRLRECVEQFAAKTIVMLGDFVADEFQYGEISRVSRESASPHCQASRNADRSGRRS